MFRILLIIFLCILLLFLYSCLRLSSEISREEEKRDLLLQQQEYGKLKKD